MSLLDDSPLKTLASAIARDLADDGGDRSLDLMRRMGLLDLSLPAASAARGSAEDTVGIWRLTQEDGEARYRRGAEFEEEWPLWADVDSFPAVTERKRVVLIGESVARGIFYDPHYTPAQLLESSLNASGVPGGVEVVDLARTSLGEDLLLSLLRSCLRLRPSLIVLFVGNNWHRLPLLGVQGRQAAAVLRERGVAGLKAVVESRLATLVETRIRRDLAALAQRVPVLLMIPEFNLGDWQAAEEFDAPLLQGDGNQRWLEHLAAGQQALASGDAEAAASHGAALVTLDGGTAAAGFRLQAAARRQSGDLAATRLFLEKARDADLWDPSPRTPRALSVVQNALRRGAAAAGIPTVDLPEIFARHLEGGIPDRRLFVDYCHLSSEGLRLAMAAAAHKAGPLLGGPEADFETLRRDAPTPSPQVESEAHFTVAVHNAHWGQGSDIVGHHCRQALACYPETARAMELFLELQSRQVPDWMASAYERLEELGTVSLRRYLFRVQHGKMADRILTEAISQALAAAGRPDAAPLLAIRAQEFGLCEGSDLDLLDPFHRRYWVDPGWDWSGRRYFTARSPVSSFDFLDSGDRPAVLELTYRLALGGDVSRPLEVVLNGQALGLFSLAVRWRRQSVPIPAAALRPGYNTLELHWPRGLGDGEAGLLRAAETMEREQAFDLRPTFGELFELTLQAQRPAVDGEISGGRTDD